MYNRYDWGHILTKIPRTNIVKWIDAYAYPIVKALGSRGIRTKWSCGGSDYGKPIQVGVHLSKELAIKLLGEITTRMRKRQITNLPIEMTVAGSMYYEEGSYPSLTFRPAPTQLHDDNDHAKYSPEQVEAWNKTIFALQVADVIDNMDLSKYKPEKEKLSGKFITLELVTGNDLESRLVDCDLGWVKVPLPQIEAGYYFHKGYAHITTEVYGERESARVVDPPTDSKSEWTIWEHEVIHVEDKVHMEVHEVDKWR